MLLLLDDEYFMRQALREAEKAYADGEVPVGAVLVSNYKIIARGHNTVEQLLDVTAHAEILAITAASSYFNAKYLTDCTLYVTLEPCVMCAGALAWAQVGAVVYGANDEKKGFSRHEKNLLHPKTIVRKGVLADSCSKILKRFFEEKR